MICPECKKEDKKSIVQEHGGISTLMYYQPFYDEDGKRHNHDGNRFTMSYSCSNGHKWLDTLKKTCSNCEWTNE